MGPGKYQHHSHHDQETGDANLRYTRICQEDRTHIAEMLRMDINPCRVLDIIQDSESNLENLCDTNYQAQWPILAAYPQATYSSNTAHFPVSTAQYATQFLPQPMPQPLGVVFATLQPQNSSPWPTTHYSETLDRNGLYYGYNTFAYNSQYSYQ